MRKRLLATVVAATSLVILASGCGQQDDETPTAPGVSRAEPTGTVNTTVPTSAPAS